MIDLQRRVARFMHRHRLQYDGITHMLDLVSEVGELAKTVVEGSDYGRREVACGSRLADELGDTLYSLLALATVLDLDAGEALVDALDKYEGRIIERGRPGSL